MIFTFANPRRIVWEVVCSYSVIVELKSLDVGPDVNLLRKGGAVLNMQLPVRLGNLWGVSELLMNRRIDLFTYRIRADLAILSTSIHRPLLEPRNVDHSVNNGVSYMNALRAKLPRKRLA